MVSETKPLKVAVIGHVEWVEFLRVDHVPKPGEIVAAGERWEEAAGGGAVAAVQLAKLAGSCDFYTALGDDERGHRAVEELEKRGVKVHAVFRPEPQRRGITFIDQNKERTITVIGEKMHPRLDEAIPWDQLKGYDAIYCTAGSPEVFKAAREGTKVLVSTARELPNLEKSGVELDALVMSGNDPGERYNPGDLTTPPKLVFRTEGAKGGLCQPSGEHWSAAPLDGPIVDTYGAGDSFAAGLTYALGAGMAPKQAAEFGARCSVQALRRRGAHGEDPAEKPST